MKRLLGMLGLCARAGRLVTGGDACERLVRSGRAKAVFIDAEASANTRKAISNACETYNANLMTLPEGELGRAIGKPGRMVAATADESFAANMTERYRLLSGVH